MVPKAAVSGVSPINPAARAEERGKIIGGFSGDFGAEMKGRT